MDAFDLLVLSDVSSKDLNADQLQAIDDYVRGQGGGLIVLGGERTFGETALRNTRQQRVTSVTAAAAAEEAEKTVLAMVLVIDRSQSMEEDNRLGLAKRGCEAIGAFVEMSPTKRA